MKRSLQIAALALLVTLSGSWLNSASAQPGYDEDISYQEFYDELSPHGQWIDYPEYGYVWVPRGISGFRPYETGGHWVWTDGYEWMWVSDYSWGWAPFHYGRWFHDPFYGWMWVPGYEWAPAWVAWRDGGDYYGWAPLRPGFNLSINISIGSYNPPMDYWCFTPRRYISSPRIYNYCVDRSRNVTIINNTTIINNYGRRNNVFINGPRRMDAERYAGRITPVRFRESSRAGRTVVRNNEVSVFRPRVRQDNNRQFRPGNVTRYERNGNNAGNNERNVRNPFGQRNNNSGDRNVRNPFGQRNNEVRQRGNNDGNRQQRQQGRVFNRDNNNTQPGSGDRNVRNPFGQRNNEVRQRGNNDGDRQQRQQGRVFNRENNNTQQPGNGDRNVRNPFGQRNNEVRQQPRNNDGDRQQRQGRVFERRNDGGSQPNREFRTQQRQPSPQAERQQQQRPQRQFGNGNNGGGGGREQRGGGGGNERKASRPFERRG